MANAIGNRRASPQPWWIAAGYGGMLLCWVALLAVPQLFTRHWPFQALFALAFGGYCVTLAGLPPLRRMPERVQIVYVLGGALLLHLPLLFAPHAFSDDIFRYVWNGRVSAAGIDPYAFAPGDAALAPLRDALIWPNINAKAQPSPYPPLLEALFALVYRVAPESLLALRITMTALNLGVSAVLAALLRRRGRAPADALIYAWSPAAVFQVAFSAHNEPLMLLCLLLCLLWADRRLPTADRALRGTGPGTDGNADAPGGNRAEAFAAGVLGRGRDAARANASALRNDAAGAARTVPVRVGFMLGLAILAKLVPLLALPALFRWSRRAALVCALTVAAVYAALLLRGQRVLAGVLYEADTAVFNDGAHYIISRAATLLTPANAETVTSALSAGLLLLTVLWAARRADRDLAGSVGVALAAYVVFAASVTPWYALWVLPFVALDALPQPWRAPGERRTSALLLSYWVVFSWSAVFSELFYFEPTPVWIVAHALVYALPLAALGLCALLGYNAQHTEGAGAQ